MGEPGKRRRERGRRVIARAFDDADVGALGAALEALFEGAAVGPLFRSVGHGDLDALVETARMRDPTYKPPRFDRFLAVEVPGRHALGHVVDALTMRRDVALAYREPRACPPAAGDSYANQQGYLDPSSAVRKGIDAVAAWAQAGGMGAGIGFADIELDWKLDHEDLPPGIALRGGTRSGDSDDRVHGTNTLGVVCAVHQNDPASPGVRGIAPDCTVRGVFSHDPGGVADAIASACAVLALGDILLVEVHMEAWPLYAFGASHVPVEAYPVEFEAIRLATALGIVVVEPAGNDMTQDAGGAWIDVGANGSDLGDLKVQDLDGNWLFGFRRSVRDSGAILVAAAQSIDRSRSGFSNYGERVDCFAWGEGVHTTTTDATGAANQYTPAAGTTPPFGGTSAASAIVAGAAIVVQGIAAQAPGVARAFGPVELRGILSDPALGTPSSAPATEPIGVMPDLGAIVPSAALTQAPDVYIRDWIGDTGEPPSSSAASSPDIIVHEGALTAAQAEAMYGAGTENDAWLGESDLTPGSPYSVVIRVWNRGAIDAANVGVSLWVSPFLTIPWPALWSHVGDAVVPLVPAGDGMRLAPPIPWTPAEGLHCLVAIADHPADPLTKAYVESLAADFTTWSHVVRRRNNLAERNVVSAAMVHVFDPPDQPARLSFQVPEPGRFAGEWRLEVVARTPPGTTVFCGMGAPPGHGDSWTRGPVTLFGRAEETASGEGWRLACRPNGTTVIGPSGRLRRACWKLWLEVFVPPDQRDRNALVSVRQVRGGEEYGRVTWRLRGRPG